MRRPPFQVNPLALSVALLLATPILAFAQNIQTETSTTITSEVSNVGVITINNVDNLTQITGKVLGDAQQPLIKQGTVLCHSPQIMAMQVARVLRTVRWRLAVI